MEPSTSGSKDPTPDPVDDKKKLNEDLVVFMRKRSETDTPRYTARLKTYVDFQEKKRRAEDARQHRPHQPGPPVAGNKKSESEHRVRKIRSRNAARFWLPNTQPTKPKPKTHCGIDDGEHGGSENGQQTRRRSGVPDDHMNTKRKRMRSISSRSEPSDRCGRRRRRRCGRRRRRRRCCSGRRRRRRRRCCCRRRRRRTCRRRRRRCGRRRRRRC